MDIEGIFKAVQRQMEAELEAVRYAITHAGVKGAVNEEVIRRFLRNYLPSNLAIDSGFIVDTNGKISKQLDIIIYDAAKIPTFFMATGLRVIPVECVYAVVEVKTSLTVAELDGCFANMESVKILEKKALHEETGIIHSHFLYGKEYTDWPIMYFVFAFESVSLKTLATKMREYAEKAPLDKRIDSLYSLQHGLITNCNAKGVLSGAPEPDTRLVGVVSNHLLLFYSLMSHYMNQVRMRNFNLNKYIKDFQFQFTELF
jgi:hypothetical protein